MRWTFKELQTTLVTPVFIVKRRTGTFCVPCVDETGAIESSGVKVTRSGYGAMIDSLVVSGGVEFNETSFGVMTLKALASEIVAPTVTCSPESCTPLLFKSL